MRIGIGSLYQGENERRAEEMGMVVHWKLEIGHHYKRGSSADLKWLKCQMGERRQGFTVRTAVGISLDSAERVLLSNCWKSG